MVSCYKFGWVAHYKILVYCIKYITYKLLTWDLGAFTIIEWLILLKFEGFTITNLVYEVMLGCLDCSSCSSTSSVTSRSVIVCLMWNLLILFLTISSFGLEGFEVIELVELFDLFSLISCNVARWILKILSYLLLLIVILTFSLFSKDYLELSLHHLDNLQPLQLHIQWLLQLLLIFVDL